MPKATAMDGIVISVLFVLTEDGERKRQENVILMYVVYVCIQMKRLYSFKFIFLIELPKKY